MHIPSFCRLPRPKSNLMAGSGTPQCAPNPPVIVAADSGQNRRSPILDCQTLLRSATLDRAFCPNAIVALQPRHYTGSDAATSQVL
jgi:hypothetical protein